MSTYLYTHGIFSEIRTVHLEIPTAHPVLQIMLF